MSSKLTNHQLSPSNWQSLLLDEGEANWDGKKKKKHKNRNSYDDRNKVLDHPEALVRCKKNSFVNLNANCTKQLSNGWM